MKNKKVSSVATKVVPLVPVDIKLYKSARGVCVETCGKIQSLMAA